ncbi:MAG: trypsin-like peptidase domain-containing protein [Candidatus Kryptoniota bacterium]
MRRILKDLIAVVLLTTIAVAAIAWWSSRTGGNSIDRNLRAVATLIVYGSDGTVKGQGSGIFINSEGLLATNAHVVNGAANVVAKLASGAFYAMKEIKGINRNNDLALLQFDAKETPCVSGLGNSDEVKIGENIYAIGTPNGQEATLSEGNISYPLREVGGIRLIQFTAPISPGSSGGGLFDENGKVIGITSSSLNISSGAQAGLAQNLNYAVPVNDLDSMIADTSKHLESNPTYYYTQGTLADNRKDWNKAMDFYSEAITLDSTYADAYMGLAGDYYSIGNYELEVNNYLLAVKLAPSNSDAYYYLGTAYEDVAQYDSAFAAFKTALSLDPNDKDTNHDFAILCLAMGDKKDARLLINNLSRLDPGWGKVLQVILDHGK